jgi:hypothetical protein
MPKINRINNIQTYNCNNSIGHNKMHNHNYDYYDYYDNSIIVVFLLSIILNIKLIITLSKKNNNRQINTRRRRRFRIFNSNNESYTINNVNTQTEPEFLSIIVNPNNEFNIIKE